MLVLLTFFFCSPANLFKHLEFVGALFVTILFGKICQAQSQLRCDELSLDFDFTWPPHPGKYRHLKTKLNMCIKLLLGWFEMEDDLTGRQPHRKMISQDDDLMGRQPPWNTTSKERPHKKMISLEDNITGRQPRKKHILKEKYLTWRRCPYRKTIS